LNDPLQEIISHPEAEEQRENKQIPVYLTFVILEKNVYSNKATYDKKRDMSIVSKSRNIETAHEIIIIIKIISDFLIRHK
jgi:hypothetical protein